MDEIEKLYLSLGITPDEPSASVAVEKMLKAVQTKLNSSVYGGKKGVITLPATIEGTYKNGKEIEQNIKDAYAAIYQKAKQMADKSVSLTLEDLKDFKNQINKFSKLTSKKNGNDVIANANNNLRQVLSDYQDFVNDLRKQTSIKQKQDLKMSPPKKPAKKRSTNYISDEEIDAAIAKENERQAKIKEWRDKQAAQLSSKLDYKSNSGIDPGKTNSYSMNASEFSEYESQWARELAKTIKETYKTTVDKQWIDKEYKPKTGSNSRGTTREEHLNFLSNAAFKDLANLIAGAEKGDKDVTFDKIIEAIGVMRTIYEENGKSMDVIAKKVIDATQGRYDDSPRRKNGGTNREEGTVKGVGKGHEQTQAYQSAIQQLLKKLLGEVEDISRQDEQATKAAIKMTNQYEQYKESAKNSNASKDTKRMADELKGESSRDTRSYIQDVRESSREASADTAEGQKNLEILETEKQNTNTGLNTDAKTKELIDAVKTPKKEPTKKDKTEIKKEAEVKEETEENAEPIKAEIPTEQLQEILSTLGQPSEKTEGLSPVETILKSIQKTLGSINKDTGAISKRLTSEKNKKDTRKKKTTSGGKPPKTPQNEQQSEEIGNLLPDVIRKVALETVDGKPKLTTKVEGPVDKPITSHNEFDRPYSIKPNELISRNAAKSQEFADKHNEGRPDTDRPKTAYGTDSNPLLPMLIDEVKTAIPKMEHTGNKQVYEKPSDIELPGWAKAEKAVEDQTKALEDEEKARKKLADQVALETKLAKQRNNNKLQPRTPAVIKLGDEQDSDTSKSLQDMLKKAFAPFSKQSAATQAMQMSASERAQETARRMKLYGKPRGRGDASDLGVVSDIRYSKNLWRGNDKSRGADDPLFRDIRKTDSISGVDPDKVLDGLQKAIQDGMFKAQTGGVGSNLLGAVTGGLSYFAQPSLEKSRAQAEGLNQVMADVRNEVLKILEAIKGGEDTLTAMQNSGDAVFNDKGQMTSGTPEAIAVFNELENSKDILDSLLAETANVDAVVKECGGDIGEIVQKLSFVAPELRKENVIIQNIGKGLDKNGKALKFQNRGAEVLNYSFQLMSRHIGQIVKNWMMMLNPISLMKKAFQDFASYDVKWQRTMNVIKYNLRRIVKPMMEWIAQQIVNIIGLVNALMKGIGKVFNQNWDLFDQSAASAEQMREELEQAANVTAGFDELHDIGGESSSNPAEDLMGDIYTPQWDGLNKVLEDIGETIGNIIKAVKNWSFWDWLILIGAALAGFIALKWLIGLFTGGSNPLQTIAKGFSFLEKAVGWAILIWAFTEFTKALTEFVECMKTAEWEDIVKSLLMLGGAFAELFLAAGGLMYLSAALSLSAPALLGIGAVVGSLALFTEALIDFIECMKSAEWEDIVKSLLMLAGAFAVLVLAGGGLMFIASALGMLAPQMFALALVIAAFAPTIWALSAFVEAMKGLTAGEVLNGLLFLAGAFMAIAIAIGVMLVVLSAAIASGVGALAILALAGILAVVALVVLALADLVRAFGEAGAGIQLICEGIATIIQSVGDIIIGVMQIISDFISNIIDDITELAVTIAHEIGETIRKVIETVGDVIKGIIDSLINAIPRLLQAIVNFCHDIGPAIENSVEAIIRSITKLVNFVVSAVEYICNLVIGAINKFSVQVPDWVPGIGGTKFGFNLQKIEIPRFVPKYETGTNYVPNDGLAYLHQGEAVVPKKYNTPYQPGGMSPEEKAYMSQMLATMRSLDGTMKRGINVNGEFRQRGSDLVSVVNKTKSQTGADLLSNVAYAR